MKAHSFTVTEGRVAIEKDGRDVSGLHLGRREFQVGRGAYVSMGTIGGVSTRREYRGQGLSSAVMARTLAEMRQRGLASTGLYTGTRIVAHRLYRRFGYVDVFIPNMRTLILNMRAFLKRQARSWLRRAEGTPAGARAAAGLRGTVVFDLGADGCYSLSLDRGEATVRKGRSRAAELTLSLSQAALVSLFARTVSSAELLRRGELQVSGSKALWRGLQGTVLPRWETPIEEE